MTENTTPNMNETEIKVKTLINKIRPYLQRDGGDVEYVRMDEGIVYVRLHGACVGCTSADLTLKDLDSQPFPSSLHPTLNFKFFIMYP